MRPARVPAARQFGAPDITVRKSTPALTEQPMRTTLLLLSAAAIVAACAQDGSTSPASHNASPTAGARLDNQAWPPGPTGAAKANSPGTMFTVTSPLTIFDGISIPAGVAVASCPIGSVVTGGGYEFTNGAAYATVVSTEPYNATAWKVYVQSNAVTWFKAFALCLQQ